MLCVSYLVVSFCFLMLVQSFIHRTELRVLFFFQAEDGIRDLVRSRGLGDVYKRQPKRPAPSGAPRLMDDLF